MRNVPVILVGAALFAGGSLGCGGTDAPDFPGGDGQPMQMRAYSQAPYGVGERSGIYDFDFVGFTNARFNGTSVLQPIQLADFYNPHAFDASYAPTSADDDDRLFPSNSPYGAGQPKPTVLLIDVASVWCGPCNAEAKNVLPALHAKYKPCGGEFLLQLAEGPTPGNAAVPLDLVHWTTKYNVDFPSTIDPSFKLMRLTAADAFPANMILDTTTMQLVEVNAGVPPEGGEFWRTFEAHLDKSNPACTIR